MAMSKPNVLALERRTTERDRQQLVNLWRTWSTMRKRYVDWLTAQMTVGLFVTYAADEPITSGAIGASGV